MSAMTGEQVLPAIEETPLAERVVKVHAGGPSPPAVR